MRHWTDQLSEYLDGTLSVEDRRSAEAHLAICEACTRTLAQLRLVVDRAQTLESRAPEVDLWAGIAARLEPRRAPIGQRIAAWFGDRRVSFTLPQLAAATAGVAALVAGLSWIAFRPPTDRIASLSPSGPGISTSSPVSPSSPTTSTPNSDALPDPTPRRAAPTTEPPLEGRFATFDEARYESAVADLERVLRDHRSDLDTSTVRILEQNLALIDRALLEARRALEADPANPYLNNHLAEQMKRKIRLLQTAADVVAAHS